METQDDVDSKNNHRNMTVEKQYAFLALIYFWHSTSNFWTLQNSFEDSHLFRIFHTK